MRLGRGRLQARRRRRGVGALPGPPGGAEPPSPGAAAAGPGPSAVPDSEGRALGEEGQRWQEHGVPLSGDPGQGGAERNSGFLVVMGKTSPSHPASGQGARPPWCRVSRDGGEG